MDDDIYYINCYSQILYITDLPPPIATSHLVSPSPVAPPLSGSPASSVSSGLARLRNVGE